MKQLKRISIPVLLLGAILLTVALLILKGDGAEIIQGKYVPQVVISAQWGEKNLIYDEDPSNPGEFGLFNPPEGGDSGPEKGPGNFTISPNGEIYILDNLNQRVQRFNSEGRFIGVVPKVQGGDDIIVDIENNIYVGIFDWTFYPKVEKYDQTGNLLITYHLGKWDDFGDRGGYRSINHWGGGGNISCDNSGRLFIKYVKPPEPNTPLFPNDTIPGNTVFIFQFGTTSQEFTFEQQMSTLQIRGYWGLNTNLPNWENYLRKIKGKIYSLNSERNALKSLAKKLAQPREGFIGIDEDAVYNILRNEKNPDSSVILKYNYDGDLIASYTLNWAEGECKAFQTEYQGIAGVKKNMVFDKGTLYTYIDCKDGLKIIKWSPVEGGK
jgi:hypothetical protein